MDLKTDDVAKLLNVSPTQIKELVETGAIPSYKIGNDYFFNSFEIENWVLEGKSLEDKISLKSTTGGNQLFSLYRAIHKGDILNNVSGRTKEEVIHQAVKEMSKQLELDSEMIVELLLERERLHPTALGEGIAVPHSRECFLPTHQDVVTVVFLKEPIAYGALDGLPVHTLFFLFACDDKRHLHLLAKIAHLCTQPDSLAYMQSKPSKADFLNFIKEWERKIPLQ